MARSSSLASAAALRSPREQMTPGEELERELQPHERAHLAGHADLALGQDMPGVGIPQLERGDRAGSGTGEPGPATDVAGSLQRDDGLEGSAQGGGRGRVALRHPGRERVEQQIHRAGRVRPGRSGARRFGCLQQAAPGPHRRAERLEVGHARLLGVERLEAPRRADEQLCRLPHAALVEGDLSPQLLDLCDLQRVDRP